MCLGQHNVSEKSIVPRTLRETVQDSRPPASCARRVSPLTTNCLRVTCVLEQRCVFPDSIRREWDSCARSECASSKSRLSIRDPHKLSMLQYGKPGAARFLQADSDHYTPVVRKESPSCLSLSDQEPSNQISAAVNSSTYQIRSGR
jgi:hypothetical protein